MRVLGGSSGKAFALTGDVEGRQRVFVLRRGVNAVGRGRECDIVLDSSGVSDRHGVVEVGDEGISVRDLASKNGTFVGGQRISSAAVGPGESVQFGPVTLRVEELDPDDAVLSVAARQPDEAVAAARENGTSTVAWTEAVTGTRSRRWLRLLDEVSSELACGAPSAVGRALATLSRGLGMDGAILLSLSAEGSPIVTASYGELPGDTPVEIVEEARLHAGKEGSVQVREAKGELGRWLIAAGPSPGAPALLLTGSAPGEDVAEAVLRIVQKVFAYGTGLTTESLRPEPAAPSSLHFPKDYVPGDSPEMKTVYSQIGSVARSDLPLLLVGETGVGKECLAETIHLSSGRSAGPFLPINCAAIPADLLEAELFGISKGVATGVVERSGRFKLAEGGTLFLDEIGDMSSALQAKLLRALEEKVIQPVGGETESVDVRLIAATNTDLGRKVETGEFRRDLYYRLAGLVVTIPALRRRMDDLGGLIEFFFHQAREEAGRDVTGLTVGAMRRLAERRWPGNVRELRHAVRRLVFMCPDGRAIDSSMVEALEDSVLPPGGGAGDLSARDFSAWESLDLAQVSKGVLREALRRAGGNQTAAAALLGITRSSLRRRLIKYSIESGKEKSG